ncbi:MAG: hypothetical protein ABEH35_06455 [Haloarculaceae archaeon]
MSRPLLERANREVLRAIETPPDSGIEDRLDRLAARLWYLAEEHPRPDQGHLARVQYRLDRLAERARSPRARRIERARDCVDSYRRLLDPI